MFREDRYESCRIDPIYLRNQTKRGISCGWFEGSYYSSIEGFHVTTVEAPWQDTDERVHLMITSLQPLKWNRRVNDVISYLDRITMFERIKNDDESIGKMLPTFNLEQITAFINAANKAQAHKSLAVLMDYKNTHFADFDPMDEFTLEF